MNNAGSVKAVFFPYEYCKYKCVNYKIILGLLITAYILSFICVVASVKSFVSDIFDDVAEIVERTDNFYMSDAKFHYDGERFEETVAKLGLNIIIDPLDNPPDATDSAVLYIGPERAFIATDFFTYSVSYSQLVENPSDIDFDKKLVTSQIDYGKTIVNNIISSAAFLIIVLFALVLLAAILLISLILSAASRFLQINLEFKKKLCISASSMIYPILFSGVIAVIPGGLSLLFGYASLISRMYVAIVLLYLILALIPFNKLNKRENNKE